MGSGGSAPEPPEFIAFSLPAGQEKRGQEKQPPPCRLAPGSALRLLESHALSSAQVRVLYQNSWPEVKFSAKHVISVFLEKAIKDTELLQLAPGLMPPWLVAHCTFQVEGKRLDIHLDFPPGSVFICAGCGRDGCKVHDATARTWRHLNFFEHQTCLHVRLPRTQRPDCGVKTVAVPWAREGSGFTLLFEAFIMTLAKEMPVNAIARLAGEHDTRLRRILQRYVTQARRGQDHSEVQELGIDETFRRRGHNYITVFVDLAKAKVLFVTGGKDAGTLAAFGADLGQHHGHAGQIREVCCDMSPAFISGAEATFPQAALTFDKLHVMKIINEAVDEVRRAEQGSRPELKKSRHLWLKNQANLTAKEQSKFASLKGLNLKTVRAYHLKLNFQEMRRQPRGMAETYLKKWYCWATHSRLPAMIKAAKTIKRHWAGVLRWFKSRITNGVLEGINSLIQAAKARGYRSTKNLITMVYLIAGKLDLRLTHTI